MCKVQTGIAVWLIEGIPRRTGETGLWGGVHSQSSTDDSYFSVSSNNSMKNKNVHFGFEGHAKF